MAWSDDFMALAHWALQSEDLRHRLMGADTPSDIDSTPGIAWAYEGTLVQAILQAAIFKGYRWGKTVSFEEPYPGERDGNGPRADLAFKDAGRGKNWAYIEVKRYSAPQGINDDIEKLRTIKGRAQRWVFTYRVRKRRGTKSLEELLGRNFQNDLMVIEARSFPTFTLEGEEGLCELALARVR